MLWHVILPSCDNLLILKHNTSFESFTMETKKKKRRDISCSVLYKDTKKNTIT